MNYQTLKDLIKTHPQWPSVTDADLVTWVNAAAVTKTYERLSTGTIFAIVMKNIADFRALTADEKQLVRDILYIHSGEGVPTQAGTPARQLLQSIFAGTTTLTELGQAVTYQITRAANVGWAKAPAIYDISEARRLAGG